MLFLKEHKEVALHVACGDITEVVIQDGRLIITANDKTVFSILNGGKREIERALSWQGLELAVDIIEKENEKSKFEQDFEKLKKFFGDKLKIKE